MENNNLVIKTIEECHHLPLAISIIAALNFQTDSEWKEASNIITKTSFPKELEELPDYSVNLFNTFALSVKDLANDVRDLFYLLGVFEPVEITLASVVSLWKEKKYGLSETEIKELLRKLDSRSLLKFTEGPK